MGRIKGFFFEKRKKSRNRRNRENLWIGGTTKLDITSKTPKVLVRSIRVTYTFDCVSMSGVITDDFLNDSLRGVRKTRTKSFSVGLKVDAACRASKNK